MAELADELPTAVCVVDPAGTITYANARATDVLGWGATRLDGRSVADVFGPLDELLADPVSAGRKRQVVRADRREITVGYSIATGADEAGRPRHLLCFQDITSWQAIIEERNRLLKLAAVGSTLPTLLHELKNPIAAITLTVELLCEEVTEPGLLAQLASVLSEIRRLSLSLDGVGAIGRDIHSPRCAAIDHTVREALIVLAARARRGSVHLRGDVADMPLLPFEPAVVGAVVLNLTVNAIQACAADDTVMVHAGLIDHGRTFSLTVADTGQGMTHDVYCRCTELFYSTKRTGSGIGLALCHQIAAAAGGELEITSVPSFGTSIVFRVPVSEPVRHQEC
ncbi:MAG: PAS domain-containing protein [Deltaproteobacteria bacterium]|nr:PAS domain-containing protein [Deltaproteobacteria bacterium]